MSDAPLLELRGLSTHYVSGRGTRVVRAVDDVSLSLAPARTLGIVGAIGISCSPRLLIADEPTTSLDLTIQAQYLNLLRDLQREHRLALIFITHNLGIVAKMCDQVAVMYGGRLVEWGPVTRIFDSPAHPYTRALLESIPRMGDGRERLTAVEGQPPDLAAPPSGCAFHPRCPHAMARCREEAPPETVIGPTHTARCWLNVPTVVGAAAPTAVPRDIPSEIR